MTEENKENEMHPVVVLLLKRAATHPEEVGTGKWSWVVAEIMKNGNAEERTAVEPIVKKAALDNAHKRFMRELLNPGQGDLFTVENVNKNINPYQSELTHRQAQAMKLK